MIGSCTLPEAVSPSVICRMVVNVSFLPGFIGDEDFFEKGLVLPILISSMHTFSS